MRIQFASTPDPPAPTINVVAGNKSTAASYYLWIYCRCRGGFSKFSPGTAVSVGVNQGLEVVLPEAIQTSASVISEIGIALSTDSNQNNACTVATYRMGTNGSLPGTVSLLADEHFKLFGTVSTNNDLPTLSDRINGMRRNVDDVGQILAYDGLAQEWKVIFPQQFNDYVASRLGEYGCDLDYRDISDSSIVQIPDYGADGSRGEEVVYWLVNDDTTTSIPQGSKIRVAVSINNVPLDRYLVDVSEDPLRGLLYLTPLGHAHVGTGVLDTTGLTQVGVSVPYQGSIIANLSLEKDLLPGEAYALAVEPEFETWQLNNQVLHGVLIEVAPRFTGNFSIYNPAGNIVGDVILSDGGKRRILPNGTANSVIAANGSGIVNSYSFDNVGATTVDALNANTASQDLIITSNGSVYPGTVVAGTARRAIVSTENGVGKPTNWYQVALSSANYLISIDLTDPIAIRADYPDVIKGTVAAVNANQVRVYVRSTDLTFFKSYDAPLGNPVIVGVTGAGTNLGELPTVEEDFGLFIPGSLTITGIAGTSELPGNTYEVAVAYLYDSTVTKISHDTNLGCITEAGGSLADVFAHIARSDNPHNITAASIGAQSITEAKSTEDELLDLIDSTEDAIASLIFALNPSGSSGTPDTSTITPGSIGALASSQNLSDLQSTSTARSNLELGDSATKNIGTIAGTVAAGDDQRFTGIAIDWTGINLYGTFLDRPTADASNAGRFYTAYDINSGTTYRSNGTTWLQIAKGVNEGGSGGGGGSVDWGGIGGTLANQTDLNNALTSKQAASDRLTALSSLSDNGLILKTDTSSYEAVNLSADGRTIIEATDKATARAGLGIGDLFSRQTVEVTTATLNVDATDNVDIKLGKSFYLYKVTTSDPAWVRIYATPGDRTNDAARLITVDPSGEHGVIAEVSTKDSLTIDFSPQDSRGYLFGASMESPISQTIALAVTNIGTSAVAITVSFERMLMEL